jgi:hypothetical protein
MVLGLLPMTISEEESNLLNCDEGQGHNDQSEACGIHGARQKRKREPGRVSNPVR